MTIDLICIHPNVRLRHSVDWAEIESFGDPIKVRLNNSYDIPCPITKRTIDFWIYLLKRKLQSAIVDTQYTDDLNTDIMILEDIRISL